MKQEKGNELNIQIDIDEKVIPAFHEMWDTFPGAVWLIHKNHTILAANSIARDAGFKEGLKCHCVGNKEGHRNCRTAEMFKTNIPQLDRPSTARIRGWMPIKGYDNLYVHFSLSIPDENEK